MTPAALAAMKSLAEGATEPTGYAGWEPQEVTGEELAKLLAKGTGKVWFVWSGTVEDSLYVAITGNGPTSEANARFHSVARASVLALIAEVERLRRELEWFADEGHYEGTYRRGAGYVDAVGLERACAALRGEPELPVVVDGECMQDCDAMGVPCPIDLGRAPALGPRRSGAQAEHQRPCFAAHLAARCVLGRACRPVPEPVAGGAATAAQRAPGRVAPVPRPTVLSTVA